MLWTPFPSTESVHSWDLPLYTMYIHLSSPSKLRGYQDHHYITNLLPQTGSKNLACNKWGNNQVIRKAGLQVALSKNIGLNIGAIFQKYRANIRKMVKNRDKYRDFLKRILSSASFATLQKVRNTIHFSPTLWTLVENKVTNFEQAKKCT